MKKLLGIAAVTISMLLTACPSMSPAASISDFDKGLGYIPVVSDTENDFTPEPVSGKTAFAYFQDEQLVAGWNLGNTLDSFNRGVGSETIWGNPPANQELMNGVKSAGFDIVRVPVTWMGHIGDAPDHHISEARLKRVAEVVEMAHNAGLKVIINLHHDGATSSLTQEDGWLSIGKSYKNKDDYLAITRKFVRVWTQIAIYFKNYGDWLMFESMNEIHDGGWCWSSSFRSNPNAQLNILNEWNKLFTEAVRMTGGNNEQRYLVIPGYCTNPEQTLSISFKLPADSSPGKQVVTFHYYDPYQFSIEGAQVSWGSNSDKQKIDSDFRPFKGRFVDRDIPVIIGESGAVLQLFPDNPDREETAYHSRREYIAHVFATAKKYGLVPIYWDNGGTTGGGEKFGLFDRENGTPNSPESEYIIEAMINAVK